MDERAISLLIRRIYEQGFNAADEAVFDDYYAPTFVHHSKVIHDVDRGGEGEKQSMRRFREAIPDVRFEVIDLVVDGDRAAARLRIRGTARAAFATVPAGTVDIHAVAWFRVEAGEVGPQVAEEWLFTDAASP